MTQNQGRRETRSSGEVLERLLREGAELLGVGGKEVFLQQLLDEQKMKLVEVGRSGDKVEWLAQLCDTSTGTIVTVSLGAGEGEERDSGAVLKYFQTLVQAIACNEGAFFIPVSL